MHLDVPAPTDDVSMDVDHDVTHVLDESNTAHQLPQLISLPSPQTQFLSSPSPSAHSPRPLEATPPNLRPIPSAPVVLISTSDVLVWPKFKVDELFNEWLKQPESTPWLQQLLNDVRAGNITSTPELELSQRFARQDRTLSPTHPRSSAAAHNAATISPQQAPSSPISRLFRSHVPFGDADSSPRSPSATPPSLVAQLRSTLHTQATSDLDLGKSGSLSAIPQDHRVVQPLFQSPTKTSDSAPLPGAVTDVAAGMAVEPPTPTVSMDTDKSKPPAESETKVAESDADGIAEITAAVDKVSSDDALPVDTEMKRPERIDSDMEVVPTPDAVKQGAGEKAAAFDVEQSIPYAKKEMVKTSDAVPLRDAIAIDTVPDRAEKLSAAPAVSEPQHMEDSAATSQAQPEMVDDSALTAIKGSTLVEPKPADAVATPIPSEEPKLVTGAIPPTIPRAHGREDAKMIDATPSSRKRKVLPKFYFPCGKDVEERERKERGSMGRFFKRLREENKQPGATRSDLGELVLEVVGLPSYFAGIVFDTVLAMEHSSKGKLDKDKSAPGEGNQADMNDMKIKRSDGDSEVAGRSQHESPRSEGETKSDTTMGDAEVSGSESRHLNGFHNAVQSVASPTAAVNVPDVAPGGEHDQSFVRDFISEQEFDEFYKSVCAGRSKESRLFSVLREEGSDRDYLIPSDFKPLLRALLMCHQGLAFLHATPEFQQRYSETVIERIYFGCTRQHNGRLTLQDIKRSRLLETLLKVDEEEDINKERKFFSYEHFYVLYCRFWELDSNHDLQIDREDLMRYGSHSLTSRIVERIFGGYARPLDSPENPGFMSYTDFIWFCLSEEDKTSDTAIDYWFRCVDRDGDGLITMYDMEFFYKEQLHRMECFGHEPVQIKDILCQLLDMIKPNVKPPVIRRKDLKRCRLAGNFFNVLFNLNKFFAIEARDPLQIRQEHATPELTDWDRFAALEYLRLSAEEEEGEEESWEEMGDAANPLMAGEAPF